MGTISTIVAILLFIGAVIYIIRRIRAGNNQSASEQIFDDPDKGQQTPSIKRNSASRTAETDPYYRDAQKRHYYRRERFDEPMMSAPMMSAPMMSAPILPTPLEQEKPDEPIFGDNGLEIDTGRDAFGSWGKNEPSYKARPEPIEEPPVEEYKTADFIGGGIGGGWTEERDTSPTVSNFNSESSSNQQAHASFEATVESSPNSSSDYGSSDSGSSDSGSSDSGGSDGGGGGGD